MDVVSPSVRSRMMAGIRGRDTRPELIVRSYLHRLGFRFVLAAKGLPGRPDIVLPKWRAVVMVHGCFWHGHAGCNYFKLPSTRPEFWKQKILQNSARDDRVLHQLRGQGWRVATVWECALRVSPEKTLAKVVTFLRSNRQLAEFAGAHSRRDECRRGSRAESSTS